MATEKSPLLSVVMPVYDEERHVEEAVRSVTNQTFSDFEFIIVNDGSGDGSKDILERLASEDERIRLCHQENGGSVVARNRGLELAQGKYVACMDADDVTLPERFAREVHFLETHHDVGIVGTQVEILNAEGEVTMQWAFPTEPDVIAWQLLFSNCITHPSTMMRHSLIKDLGGYALWSGSYAADYELYTRALLASDIANLPQVLHQLRRWEGSVTKQEPGKQKHVMEQAAATLHQAFLGKEADESLAHLLVRMQKEDVIPAAQVAGAANLQTVAAYVRALYAAFRRRFAHRESSIAARRRALFQLGRLSDRIREEDGRLAGFVSQLQAKLMVPRCEIGPWLVEVLRSQRAK